MKFFNKRISAGIFVIAVLYRVVSILLDNMSIHCITDNATVTTVHTMTQEAVLPNPNVPFPMFFLSGQKVSWCQAAKVASTSTKMYFLKISNGEIVIPENSRFGIHNANFARLSDLSREDQTWVKNTDEYTHVFIVKNVVERFVSGFLDKVVFDCKNGIQPYYAIHYYIQYGFSCDEHQDLEAFVSLMEKVPKMDGHFHAQASLCNLRTFPYTDIIYVDDHFDEKLRRLSEKIGVVHPAEEAKTRKHSTGANQKMVDIFRGKKGLLARILNLFDEDCRLLPEACDVDDLLASLEEKEETMV